MKVEKPFKTHTIIELPGYDIDPEFKKMYAGPKEIEIGTLRTTPERIYGLMRRQLIDFVRTTHKLEGMEIAQKRTIEAYIYSIDLDRMWGCARVIVTPINDIEATVTLRCAALLFSKYWANIYFESLEFIDIFASYLRKIFRLPISDSPSGINGTLVEKNSEEPGNSLEKTKDENLKKKTRQPRRDAIERVALAIFLFENGDVPTWVSAATRARTTVDTINQLENLDKVNKLLSVLKSSPNEVIRIKQKVAKR